MVSNKLSFLILIVIFLNAIFLRFLYFPDDIYFGFDQARDAFASLQLLRGDLRFVGPPTGVEGLFHGAFYYYLYAPTYLLFKGDPSAVSAVLRIINAAVIFLVFFAGTVIYNRRTGLIASFLFAISFEQTQYALYFNHPSLAVVSVTLFYLGLGLLFFKKEAKGWIIAALGLGLSLQFEFVLIYLFFILIVMLIIFRKSLPKLPRGLALKSLAIFILSVSTFILAEVKFNFRALNNLTSVVSATGDGVGPGGYLNNTYLLGKRFISDNLFSFSEGSISLLVFLLITSIFFLTNKDTRAKIIFLLIWVIGGILPYLNNKSATPLYYYSVGASVGMLILSGFFVTELMKKFNKAALIILIIPLVSNWSLIAQHNPQGVIPTINVQTGMLLSHEKKVIDFIYQNSNNQPFAVRALTMPLSVNTTWSYLFEWYGKSKYGYLPTWIGPNALGYYGNLKIVDSRSKLPKVQFLIIEPTRGIRQGLIDSFMTEESYFTKIVEEKKIGDFIVQVRVPF